MALEAGTYISDLVATNPVGATDPKSQGDDHLRLIKAAIKATFPNIDGAVNATPAQLNHVVGVTSAIQTQLDSKAADAHVHSVADITSGTLAVARGGTGIASYTTGNYIRASGATTLEQRTAAQVLSDIDAAASSHDHAGVYATASHNHSGVYATASHNHSGVYEPVLATDRKRKITISASDPAGGVNGDIWLKV